MSCDECGWDTAVKPKSWWKTECKLCIRVRWAIGILVSIIIGYFLLT